MALLCVACASVCGVRAIGQIVTGDADELLTPYRSNAGGFEIQVPAGWSYDYGGFAGPGGSRGLMRGGSLTRRIAVQVLMFRDADASDFKSWVSAFAAAVGKIDGVLGVEQRAETVAGRPAAAVLVRARVDVDLVETVYTCVPFDDATVWVLSYGTARAGEEPTGPVTAPPLADRIVDSLHIFYDAELAGRLKEAKRRGASYVRETLPADIRALRIDEKPRYYLIKLAGQDIGYMVRRFHPESHSLEDSPKAQGEGRRGLRVSEQVWRFPERDTVRYESNEIFSSVDGENGLYEFTTSTTAPADAAVQQPFVTRDECVRGGDSLVTSYTTSRHVVMPNPRDPLKLDADYLGLAWVRVLPGLLHARDDSLYTFSRYDPDSRELLSYSIRYLGERPVPGSGAKGQVYEARDGLSDVTRLLYADAYGNLLREEHGDTVLQLSDAAAVEQRFGARRDAARERLSSK